MTGARYRIYFSRAHPTTWAALRSSRGDDPIRADLRHIRFVLRSEFKELGGPELTRRGTTAKVMFYVYISCFLLFVLTRSLS